MTQTVLRALQGLQPRRRLPGFACFLGALALAILAGCNSSGCGGMGGGSGYQVDGLPGLLSCSSTTSSTNGAGGATDPMSATMVAQNTGFNSNANTTGIIYPMPGTMGTLPAAGTSSTLTLTGPAHPNVNPSSTDYTLTASPAVSGDALQCEIAGGGLVYADSIYGAWSGTSATLQLNYPMFTGGGSFTINCVGVNGGGNTTLATLTVNVP